MEKQPRLLVIGFGMIGASLAARLSGNGFAVDVLVRSEGSAHRGLERYRDIFDALVQKGLVTPAQAEASENRVRIIYDYPEAADAEVAFECAAEVIGEKREIYRQVGKACPNIRAIASTSSATVRTSPHCNSATEEPLTTIGWISSDTVTESLGFKNVSAT